MSLRWPILIRVHVTGLNVQLLSCIVKEPVNIAKCAATSKSTPRQAEVLQKSTVVFPDQMWRRSGHWTKRPPSVWETYCWEMRSLGFSPRHVRPFEIRATALLSQFATIQGVRSSHLPGRPNLNPCTVASPMERQIDWVGATSRSRSTRSPHSIRQRNPNLHPMDSNPRTLGADGSPSRRTVLGWIGSFAMFMIGWRSPSGAAASRRQLICPPGARIISVRRLLRGIVPKGTYSRWHISLSLTPRISPSDIGLSEKSGPWGSRFPRGAASRQCVMAVHSPVES
jgi:hypothetical protein